MFNFQALKFVLCLEVEMYPFKMEILHLKDTIFSF